MFEWNQCHSFLFTLLIQNAYLGADYVAQVRVRTRLICTFSLPNRKCQEHHRTQIDDPPAVFYHGQLLSFESESLGPISSTIMGLALEVITEKQSD